MTETVTIQIQRHRTGDGRSVCVTDDVRCPCAIPDGGTPDMEFRYYCGIVGDDLINDDDDMRPCAGCPVWEET